MDTLVELIHINKKLFTKVEFYELLALEYAINRTPNIIFNMQQLGCEDIANVMLLKIRNPYAHFHYNAHTQNIME